MPARSRKTAPPKNDSSESTILEKIKEFGENVIEAVTKPFRHTPAKKKASRKSAGRKAPAKKAAPATKAVAKKAAPAKKAVAKKAAPANTTPAKKTAARKR